MTAPKHDVRIGDVIIRRQPPVVGVFCKAPDSKGSRRAVCVFPSKVCDGPSETCRMCRFPFCAAHFPKHLRRFTVPQDVWKAFHRRLLAWHRAVQDNAKAYPKVNVRFPPPEPEGS